MKARKLKIAHIRAMLKFAQYQKKRFPRDEGITDSVNYWSAELRRSAKSQRA